MGRGVTVGPVLKMPQPLAEPLAEPRDVRWNRDATAEYERIATVHVAVAAVLATMAAWPEGRRRLWSGPRQ